MKRPKKPGRRCRPPGSSFFILVGILNLAVAYTCETATWVNFKLFGLTSLTFIFTLAIGIWIARNAQTGQNTD